MLPEEDNKKIKLTFSKSERICSNKIIKDLFAHNNSIFSYPFKCYFKIESSDNQKNEVKIVVSVSKKIFKRAVDRNLIKRRSKEAYRLHKQNLLNAINGSENKKISILFVYIGKEILDYLPIERGVCSLLEMISKKQ
ncbi:MAG: ribonuclease P protein component [Bacteroidales bacterium]|jgi:ribonuclease P protein component|nr:ribonuclease P protein component [Bacteroidales bacterium]